MQGYLAGVMKKLRLVNRTWLVALFASAILQLAAAKADDRPTIEPVPQISHSYGIRSAAFSPELGRNNQALGSADRQADTQLSNSR